MFSFEMKGMLALRKAPPSAQAGSSSILKAGVASVSGGASARAPTGRAVISSKMNSARRM